MTLQSVLYVFFRRLAVAGAFLLSLGAVQQAQAATFTVTNTNDSGPGSLRQAVLDANSALSDDIITFDTTVFAGSPSISLSTGELKVASKGTLTIMPQGRSIPVLTSNNASRIFNIDEGANLTLTSLKISNAKDEVYGGAINNLGTLTINSSTLSNNSAPGYGGAIHSTGMLTINKSTFTTNTSFHGGAILNGGNVVITDSVFKNNSFTAYGSGGAINTVNGTVTIRTSTFSYNSGTNGAGGALSSGGFLIDTCTFSNNSVSGNGSSGGAIANGSTAIVNNSTFSNNSAPGGVGGAIVNGNKLTVNNCTFLGNSAEGSRGGAIFNNGNPTINNCTFYGNNATNGFGGAIYNRIGSPTIVSSTFSGNTAANGSGGAIFNSSDSTLALSNSIVAGNSVGSSGSGPNLSGTVSFGDFNLVDDTGGATLTGTHNITGQDPKLGSLANNGGFTQTFGLLSGSPAIDAGNSPLETDQRGAVRPYDEPGVANAAGGNGSDIGAFEADAPSNSAPIVVTRTDDRNGTCGPTNCSLREAIKAANGAPDISTIAFAPTIFATRRTIEITNTLPEITSSVILIGPNAPGTGVTLHTVPGSGLLSVRGGTLRIANLTLTGSPGSSSALTNYLGIVTVEGCTFLNNTFGILNGGSNPQETHALTVNNCTFVNNGIFAIYNGTNQTTNSTTAVNSCTITGNGSGVYVWVGSANVSNSIIVGNTSENTGNLSGTLTGDHNITTGTATQAGLDPAGLKDNGGPTPTIALVAGSPAIDVGATSLPTDQRGQLRGPLPDIGAFELNNSPSVVSVAPQGASDKVGAKRTFTLTMSDGNGADDIREMWLLINRTLDWNAGATLIYRPSANSPTSGQLFLRRGDEFLPPITIGTGASSSAVLDNGAVRVVGTEVTVSATSTGIALTLPLTIRDGLVGQNGLFARVQDSSGATDPTSLPGDLGFIRSGTYTVTPQFSGNGASAPTLSNLTPGLTNTTLSSAGIAPAPQTFGFFVKDENGIGDIDSVWFLANKTRGWNNSATFVFYPRTRRLVLRSDDGNSFLGGGQIGQPGIIENSQVRVDLSKVKVLIYADGKSLGLSLPLQAKTGLIGSNKVWLRVQDNGELTSPDGDDLGFVLKGTWDVKASNTAGANTKPSSGAS